MATRAIPGIAFRLIGITRDRRNRDLKQRYATIEQLRADAWLEIGAAAYEGAKQLEERQSIEVPRYLRLSTFQRQAD
jgi:hypothetical protein